MVIVPGDRALESGLKLRGFREAKGSDFSGKEVKTPTLPKAGRVGHPKNLKQRLSVDALQRFYPVARLHQLNTSERIGHPPRLSSVVNCGARSNGRHCFLRLCSIYEKIFRECRLP
jgi:hypothetical protein